MPVERSSRSMKVNRRQVLTHLLMIFFLPVIVCGTTFFGSPSKKSLPSKHFVLVHGSCHGAWTWYKIVELLISSGHNVTSIDLAGSGIDPQQAKYLQSISEYHRPLMELMESLPEHERVILVGHSSGGFALSQAMERFPSKISVAVFVTALMPGPQLNISTLIEKSLSSGGTVMDSRYTYDNGSNNPPTTLVLGPKYLKCKMYQLSPPEDWVLATTLVRPTYLFSVENISKEIVLTKKKYGSVNRVFIISEKDKVGTKKFQLWMIERNRPDEVVEIFGSDHMVMLSKPTELWGHLLQIAGKYT